MHRGWYGNYRKSLDHPLFKKPLIWHYWDYCLLKANHKPVEIFWNRKTIKINRGCFITGRKQAAMDTGLTEHNIRVAQETLINLGMIERIKNKSTSHFSYISVCNYIKYQDYLKINHQQSTSTSPAPHQHLTTDKNVKNDKNEKKEPKNLVKFKKFIKLYPRKEAEKTAEIAWHQLFTPGYASKRAKTEFVGPLTDKFFEILIVGLKNQIKGKERQRAANQLVSDWPHPATWLRGFRWNDVIKLPVAPETPDPFNRLD